VDSALDEQLTFRFLSAVKINPTGKPWSGARVTVNKSPLRVRREKALDDCG
jgi:hypothetical protein